LAPSLRLEKRLRWHIDYLLQQATIVEIWYAYGQERLECLWNRLVGALPGGMHPVPRFGASDCSCPSHLTYFSSTPPFGLFEGKLKELALKGLL